jgi:hypothetical protein
VSAALRQVSTVFHFARFRQTAQLHQDRRFNSAIAEQIAGISRINSSPHNGIYKEHHL